MSERGSRGPGFQMGVCLVYVQGLKEAGVAGAQLAKGVAGTDEVKAGRVDAGLTKRE